MPDNRLRSALALQGFRPLRKGEAGYSSTARRVVNPDTGEILSRRQFVKQAKEQQTQAQRVEHVPTSQPKQRKVRADKGMTKGTWKIVKEHLHAKEQAQTVQPVEETVPYSYQPTSYLMPDIQTGVEDINTDNTAYEWLAERYQARLESEQAVHLSLDEIKLNPDFQVMIEMWETEDYSPHGPMALVLEELGLRDEGAEYDVGDTPVSEGA